MNKIDMHFHSTCSDGKNTHEEILEQAKQKGLEFIALTDHDNISGDFQKKAEDFWIKSTQSLEISARNYEHEKSLHLTCYAKSFADDIYEILDGIKDARKNNLEKQVDVLQSNWFNISLWDLENISQSMQRSIEALNKFDLAKIIYEDPQNRNRWIELNNWVDIWLVEFYLQYFKRNWEKFETFWVLVPEYEPSLEVCKIIQETNNAILSIAHPNFTFQEDIWGFIDYIEYYIQTAWINALEINSKASVEWINVVKKTAEKYGLFITFWSDNHGIWNTDNKHSDFWELNPNLTLEFIEKEFEKYRNIL
jgi:hypothetical protein